MTSHDYALFGLQIRAEFPLPELASQPAGTRPDVIIRIGEIDGEDAPAGFSSRPAGTLLFVPDIGRYLIRNGREIVVAPARGASERNLRLYLLGSALGALLHQRGLMPLHANAIDVGGRAIAFCGRSGAGKSTLAAWFADRGHSILSDDVCVIGFDPAGRAIAEPGLPRLRLWNDALEATGRSAADFERSFDRLLDARDKYDVPIAAGHVGPPSPLPLGAVYLLDRAAEGETEGRIVTLSGADAVGTLVANTYRGQLLAAIGSAGDHLAICARIAAQVPLFRAERLWGQDSFEAESIRLAAHAQAIVGT